MEKTLRTALKPLYSKMLNSISLEEDLYSFCVQWGKDFPTEKYKGIAFVGKATNGWITPSSDVEILFGDTKDKIFARNDQMAWVSNLESNTNGYNTRKSAFWRVTKGIAKSINNSEKWYLDIAWSNVYKVSFHKGNPSQNLKNQQKQFCKSILEKEVKILSPEYVIFLTSGWEKVFLKHLNDGVIPSPIKTQKWGHRYYSKLYSIGKTKYITSFHPQGKKESEHINAIIQLIT